MPKTPCENAGKCKLLLDQKTAVSKIETLIPEMQAIAKMLLDSVNQDNTALDESSKELGNIWLSLTEGNVDSLADAVKKVAAIVLNQQNRNTAMTATVSEMMVQLKKENEQLQMDKLTWLYNRHKFESVFSLLEKEFREKWHQFSCALIDIDNFKNINDSYSHIVGDSTLKYLAGVLLKFFGPSQVFRFWGEEFFIMANCDSMKLSSMIQRVLDHLNRTKLMFRETTHIPLTFSGWVAEFRSTDTEESVYERADITMLEAKRAWRNRIHVWNVTKESLK